MASDLEFRHRFWIIAATYWIGFSLYAIDHKNSGHMLAQSLAHLRRATNSTLEHQLVFAAAALIAVLASTIRTWGTAYLRPEVDCPPWRRTWCRGTKAPLQHQTSYA